MSDLIDRQAAIDAIESCEPGEESFVIMSLTSVQTEIIRCKDCYLRYTSCPMVVRNGNYLTFFTKDEDFCSYGKGEEIA